MVEAEWPFSLNCVPHVVRAEWPRPKFGRSVGRFTLHGDRIDRPVLTTLQAWRIVYEVVSDYLSFLYGPGRHLKTEHQSGFRAANLRFIN